MILVVGATGYLGGEVCRLLVEKEEAVRGMVRSTSDPGTVSTLRETGVETVVGDLKDPDSLAAACEGCRAVVSTATTTRSRQDADSIQAVEQEGQIALIDAAEEAGVEHFVYVSFTGNIDSDDPLTTAKRTVEGHLVGSAIPVFTILRPSMFMESWLSPALGFDHQGGTVTIYGPGTEPVSWISLLDVARYAVAALESEAAHNQVLEIGGPEALTPLEVVEIFQNVTGRELEVEHVPLEELERRYEEAETPLDEAFAALMLAYSRGDEIRQDPAVDALAVRPTSVAGYAEGVTAG